MISFIKRKEQELSAGGSCYKAYSVLFVPFALLVFLGLLVSGREIISDVGYLYSPVGQYPCQIRSDLARIAYLTERRSNFGNRISRNFTSLEIKLRL